MPTPLDLRLAACLSRRVFPSLQYGPIREFSRLHLYALLLLSVICTSCGAVVGSGPPPPVTVTFTPTSAQPYQGESVQFSAAVQNASSSAVTWQVNGTAGGNPNVGTIDPAGLYMAPATVPNPPTVTVTAVLQSDTTKTGSSSVTILSLSSITGTLVVSPALSSLTTSQTLQLQVSTPGVSNNDVNWAVNGGTITPGGMYTPPSTQGVYTVKASLIANPNTVGTAQVAVTNFPGTLTWRNDNARSGVNSQELALAPGTVSPSTFGKLFSCPIDGYAYAQPLYVPNLAIPGNGIHNVIFVATEKDSVFAFDADCQPLRSTLESKSHSRWIAAHRISQLEMTGSNIVPFVGITGTPVIGEHVHVCMSLPQHRPSPLNPILQSHGSMRWIWQRDSEIQPAGVGIAATPGSSSSALCWKTSGPRCCLTTEPCISDLARTADSARGKRATITAGCWAMIPLRCNKPESFNVTPNAIQGGIWQSGGGPSADSNHNVFVATGDGPPKSRRSKLQRQFPPSGDQWRVVGRRLFHALRSGPGLGNEPDAMLQSGSSAPVLLPDLAGSSRNLTC